MEDEQKLLADNAKARAALDAVWDRLDAHFGPEVDKLLAEGRVAEAEAVLKRIPESPCRFRNWSKIEHHKGR